jgi:surfeit locus 1 family protein
MRMLTLRGVIVALAAVAAASGTARLGVWQLDRAAQKIALQQAIESRGLLSPLDAAALAHDAAAAAEQHYRPVHLRGEWRPAFTVYLDNRQMNGHPGFFAVTPLLLADGSAVLVQRGWLPRNFDDRTRLQEVPSAAGTVDVVGRIAPPPSRLYEFNAAAAGRIRQNLDLDAFAQETGLRLRPLSIQQADSASFAGDGLQRQWPQPSVDVSKHHGYAFQWFALSALIAGLYVWFQLVRPWRQRHAP